MKFIPLKDGNIKTRMIIDAVVSQAANGARLDEIRRRVRIIEALEKADGDTLHLEDADHSLLVKLINEFSFAIARPELVTILDEIIDAKAPAS